MSLLSALVKTSLRRVAKSYIYGQRVRLSDVSFTHRENDPDVKNFEFTADNKKVLINLFDF